MPIFKFLQRDDLIEEIKDSIIVTGIPKNKIIDKWKEESEIEMGYENIPKFRIVPEVKKYYKLTNCIETTILKILCVTKDDLYPKTILA